MTGPDLPRLRRALRPRTVLRAIAIGWLIFWWIWLQSQLGRSPEYDADGYWGFALGDLYAGTQLGDRGAFLYSPLVAWLFAPFSALPYPAFYALLSGVNLIALTWMLGWELAAVSLFALPVSNEIARGNIHLLLAAAIVAGMRWPAAWAWVLLTKVTPGIGLAWFAFRREWRNLAVAIGVTGALVGIGFAIDPDLWTRWFTMLGTNVDAAPQTPIFEIPVLPRLAVAGAIIGLAAWRDRPAVIPVAAMLALPAVWVNSLAMLVACWPIWRMQRAAGPSPDPDVAAS